MESESRKKSISEAYIQYRDELCRYVVSSAGLTNIEAEDVVQSAFARVAEVDFRSIQNHRAFLYKTSYNIAIDIKRHGAVRKRHMEQEVDTTALTIEERSPERVFEGGEQLGIIARAMWCMPQKRRQLLMMNRFDGLSYAEISRRVGLSESVVRKHVARALADCQKALQIKSS